MNNAPVLIVGAGLAGLVAAIALSPRPCVVITPDKPGTISSSAWAQGGIAAAVGSDDSPQAHAADTFAAGCEVADRNAIRILTEDGPDAIDWLCARGVPFDRDENGDFRLSREAAHGRARVVRIGGDQAGREMTRALAAYARTLGSITLRTGLRAAELIRDDHGRVAGVRAFNESGRPQDILAPATLVCTGGVGGLFQVTTNPVSACGLGLAMAAEAGAALRDLEFVQFHPTALDVGRDPAPLISEAVRGEGATLVDSDGRALCDPLAARDIVARAVHRARTDGRGAFLDARASLGERFAEHFPIIFEALKASGLDPARDLLPVSPAAHYHMGGIATDMNGRTTLEGLYAIGEAGCTGVHGANRLASNSLLEAVVVARRAAASVLGESSHEPSGLQPPRRVVAPAARASSVLRMAMQNGMGVERDQNGMKAALEQAGRLAGDAHHHLHARIASRMAEAALNRRASLGAHSLREDSPPRPQLRPLAT